MYCQTVSSRFPTYTCIPLFRFSLPPVCDFDMVGPEGYVESAAISAESRALPTEAVDCRWYIRAPPKAKVRMGALSVGRGWVCCCDVRCRGILILTISCDVSVFGVFCIRHDGA